jgi:D-alanyl-D-alanine carboxypeptidase (penicillin-binding protein 5/6)
MPVRAICAVSLLFLLTSVAKAAVPIPKAPDVPVRGYILQDHHSGRVLGEMNADQRMEPASITKLMTAYVLFTAMREKRLALDETVLISERAWRAEGSRTFVQVGTRVPVEALIQGMIVQSGNDATIALAERVGGSETAFAQMMNSYAARLGMTNSRFANSTGLPDPQLYSTARDIARLSRALIREFPDYYRWYSQREFAYNNIRQSNRNGLLARDSSVDGIKTGHTETAGYCLVSSAERDKMRLVAVVMGAKSMAGREDASAALLNWGYTFFETVKIRSRGDVVLKPRVYKGALDSTSAVIRQDIFVTVGRGAATKVKSSASIREPLIAPLALSKSIGELRVTDGADLLARVPLYPNAAVAEGGWWSKFSDSVSLWLN